MSPSNLLRAMKPLQSSIIRSTTATPFLYATRSSIISGPASFRRAASSTTISSSPTGQQQEQQQQQEQSTPSTIVPPSLRSYPYSLKTGTVVSVGRMDRTVRVSHRHSTWDPHLHKTYPKITHFLVSDPQNSLREGDVIEFSSGYPKSRNVRHVVERIIAPFGAGIEERPAVLTREERDAMRAEKRAAKWQRREERREENGEGQGVKEHVGRIRGLVFERTGAGAGAI